VKFWAVDAVGNVETAKTITFSVFLPTTATLVASPNPSPLGSTVKLTATVKASSGVPTGSVKFLNGSTTLGTATLSNGVASFTTASLPAGPLTLQASYVGAGNFAPTNSVPYDETITEGTHTALTSSLNPSTYKQSVTLTAHVTPNTSGTPTGTVKFYLGTTLLGSGTLSSGLATFTTTTFTPGTLALKAVYSGDSTYLTSTSPTLTQTVSQLAQTITFQAIPAQVVGHTRALVATASSGLAVTLTSTTPTVCSVSGTTATMLGAGSCTITAKQPGNADYKAAPAVSRTFTVSAS
jgi:hypothetical protein